MTNMLNFQSIEFDMNDEVNVSKGIRIFDKSSISSSISNITLYFTFADNVIQLSRFCYIMHIRHLRPLGYVQYFVKRPRAQEPLLLLLNRPRWQFNISTRLSA